MGAEFKFVDVVVCSCGLLLQLLRNRLKDGKRLLHCGVVFSAKLETSEARGETYAMSAQN